MNFDVIIVGGGPAGLTAGIYCARAELKTLLLDKKIPGGQLNDTSDVENYPGFEEAISGPELMERTRKQAERFGVEIKMEEAMDVEWGAQGQEHVIITDESKYHAPVVILSTGAGPVELPAKGAIELKGKGLSYCAVCDGYFFKGKKLIEVGAGDSGFTEALFLTKFADEVRMVIRHSEDSPKRFRAKDQVLVNKAMENPKVRFIWNSVVEEIQGTGKVEGVVLKNLGTGQSTAINDISGVFVNIGHLPETSFLRGKVNMDEDGYIITDSRTRTEIPGVFGVGDVRKFSGEYAQAVIAAADGCIAALEAEKYLEERRWSFGD
ncbi:FAD-dependent oxidoreductase [Candidatus Acetothermia bacterium]|nr:FAD-dependent oxidoreductase [Candidatus Acetothermia bacterium]MBI3643440.1 FAD-dependent oxidoreductase [Candidatus Acetothermia bacterium]